MKKVVLCILFICAFSLNGCNNVPQKPANFEKAETQTSNLDTVQTEINKAQTKPTDDSWKYEVAEKLYEEFCYFYKNRNKDMSNDKYYVNYGKPVQNHVYTNYNIIMAADRAQGVLVYKNYLSEDKVSYVLEKSYELNEKIDWTDRVCFGYSKTGMHYIAIMYNHTSNSYYSSPMCDKIRGDYYESNFMAEIFNESLYVQDVFAEDLSKQKNEINIELHFSDDFYFKSEFEPLAKISLETKNILKKYDRTFKSNKNSIVKENTWNVWMTERLVDYLSITCDGKKTILQHYAPTQ